MAFAGSVIERPWRSLRYEALYLHEIADDLTARRLIRDWVAFYNAERPHAALGGQTPAEAYRDGPPVEMWTSRFAPCPHLHRRSSNRKIDSRGFWRPELQPEYTLTQPPTYSKRRVHLTVLLARLCACGCGEWCWWERNKGRPLSRLRVGAAHIFACLTDGRNATESYHEPPKASATARTPAEAGLRYSGRERCISPAGTRTHAPPGTASQTVKRVAGARGVYPCCTLTVRILHCYSP